MSTRAKKSVATAAAKKKAAKNVLVIVESPAKARTISALLNKLKDGPSYKVDACNGHVTDLVRSRKDVPPELKEKSKKWDVMGVDVVSVVR